MEPEQERLLKETHRLAQENNKMLRSMRRQAWLGRLVTLIFYAALIGGPIWFYFAYMSDTVNQMLQMYGTLQGRGTEAQGQYQSFMNTLQQFQEKMVGGNAASSQQ